jgi:hypothetical protein
MKVRTKNKIKKVFGFIWKSLIKIGLASGGATALVGGVMTANIPAAIAGASALASAISSTTKDTLARNEGKGKLAQASNIVKGVCEVAMKVNNLVACNIDKAENDKKKNK